MACRFDKKYKNFLQSLNGLEEVLSKGCKNLSKIERKAICYDFSGIQENSWKILKYILEYIDGVDGLSVGSKKVYRTAAEMGLIDNDDCNILIETLNLRNNLLHEYEYNNLELNCFKINSYLYVFKKLNEKFIEISNIYKDYFEKDKIDE